MTGPDGRRARIDPHEVRRVAALVALRLEEDEVEALSVDLTDILEHMEVLGGFEPDVDRTADGSGEEGTALHPDSGDPDSMSRPPGEMAPAWEAPLFVVPRLPGLGDGEG